MFSDISERRLLKWAPLSFCLSVYLFDLINAFDKLYLLSPQADLNHFSSIACHWWGINDISFSWKSNKSFACYGNNQVPQTYNKKMLVIIVHPFSFDQMFLELADKVDMDEISNKFEKWPDQIINLRVMTRLLLKKPLFDFVISVTHLGLIGSF